MAKERLIDIMAGVAHDDAPRPKFIANNTVEYHRDGRRVIRLHHTDIAEFSVDGRTVTFNSGGWKTVTTKDRLHGLAGIRISSERGLWYCHDKAGNSTVFRDGILFYDGICTTPAIISKSAKTHQTKLAADIKKFVSRINALDALPQPSNGDCWHCSIFDRAEPAPQNNYGPGNATGKRVRDPSHLLSHIKEGYLHGALLVNAMRWAGNTDYAIALAFRDPRFGKDLARRSLRRFLRTQLGLPT